jgi:predicted enzyme related to lactoylglutathione lyase
MFEVVSSEPSRALNFYTELFGWRAGPSFDGYTLIDTGAGEGAIGGGIGPSYAEGDAGVKVYVSVDDLDAAIRKAEELGGSTVVPPTPLPEGYGTFAVVTDLDGNAVGLWK